MQNDILENTAVELILEHSANYAHRFDQLDKAIELYRKNSTKTEVLAVLVTIRKSTTALFKLANEHVTSPSEEKTEKLNSNLNELVVANMQLRSFNNLFNDNSEIINEICDFQCWLAHAAVVLTLDLGGE